MFIVSDVRSRVLAEFLGPVGRQFQREINPVVYGVEEFLEKSKNGNAFIERVLAGKKMWLIGDSDEFEGLVA